MKIKNLEIGDGKPTAIIAELGTLHHSERKNLYQATEDAINAGADMVKVQVINPEKAWWADHQQYSRYHRLYWPLDEWIKYFNKFNNKSIVFTSIFDGGYLESLVDYLPAIKFGYKARLMKRLIRDGVNSGKPVIMSLGDDVDSQERYFEYLETENTLYQYVQPIYPLKDELVKLPTFGEVYQGLSIHSNNFSVLTAAMILGCQTLEVHVQGDNADGVDTGFALTMKELERLVKMRDNIYEGS